MCSSSCRQLVEGEVEIRGVVIDVVVVECDVCGVDVVLVFVIDNRVSVFGPFL